MDVDYSLKPLRICFVKPWAYLRFNARQSEREMSATTRNSNVRYKLMLWCAPSILSFYFPNSTTDANEISVDYSLRMCFLCTTWYINIKGVLQKALLGYQQSTKVFLEICKTTFHLSGIGGTYFSSIKCQVDKRRYELSLYLICKYIYLSQVLLTLRLTTLFQVCSLV